MTLPPNPLSQEMIALVERLAPNEGYSLSALDGVRFMRSDRPLGRTPVLYEPGIVIVCQGRKLGFLGDEVYVYDAQHYLVLSVPLPFSTETQASKEEPLLAVSIRLDLATVADLALAIDAHDAARREGGPREGGPHEGGPREVAPRDHAPLGIASTPLSGELADATVRLLRALCSPLDAQVLGPALVREIGFRVLSGEQGGALRAALAHQGRFGRVARALRRIHTDFAQALDVTHLAQEAGMSVPAFHVNFKAVTQTSPIQYIKSTRLHQARLMMIRDGLTAASASARVGYESASQFSREFKRFFGRAPVEEVRDMKASFALSPAVAIGEFAAPH